MFKHCFVGVRLLDLLKTNIVTDTILLLPEVATNA